MSNALKLALCYSLVVLLVSCDNHEIKETTYQIVNTPWEKYQVVKTKDGSYRKDGFYKAWYPTGQIQKDCRYKLNQLDGGFKQYWDNGQIEIETFYEADIINGHYVSYYKNGKKKLEYESKNNKRYGETNEWHDNGKLSVTKKFDSEGNAVSFASWYSNGTKYLNGFYKDGFQSGVWVRYDESGVPVREFNFVQGNDTSFVGKWKSEETGDTWEYFSDYTFINTSAKGVVKSKGTYRLNRESGADELIYSSNGRDVTYNIIKKVGKDYWVADRFAYNQKPYHSIKL
jgi:antitoxin component YwqK of YwqJK toxin-antitoxin module